MLTCAAVLVLGVALGLGNPPRKSEVVISIPNAESPQPAGYPVVLELTLTNPGKDSVAWWCGGPERYPGAEHFVVEVRYDGGEKWHAVEATNGQYTQGSGDTGRSDRASPSRCRSPFRSRRTRSGMSRSGFGPATGVRPRPRKRRWWCRRIGGTWTDTALG